MNRLSTRNRMLVGLTLFSMFFGAGNLIFPPYLGAMAGTKTPLAMLGFAITAIGFPILGVIAVAHAGSLDELAGASPSGLCEGVYSAHLPLHRPLSGYPPYCQHFL